MNEETKEIIKTFSSIIVDKLIIALLFLLAFAFVFVVLYILFSIHWLLGVVGLCFWLIMEFK